jgi:hypothetical protein
VGDTHRGRRPRTDLAPASDGLAVFPEAGYAVVRDGLYVFLAASNNSFSHKHADDLSVLVSDAHGEVLTEAGFLSYEAVETSPDRAYTLGWRAHSTVTSAGEDEGAVSEECGLRRVGAAAGVYVVEGRSVRPDGRVHDRRLVVLAKEALVVVLDRCRAGQETAWVRRWHLGVDATVGSAGGSAVRIGRPAGPDFLLAGRAVGAEKARPPAWHRGAPDGWLASPYESLVPAPVVTEEATGRDVTWLAALGPVGNAIEALEYADGVTTVRTARFVLEIADEEEAARVRKLPPASGAAASVAPATTRVPMRDVWVGRAFRMWSGRPAAYPLVWSRRTEIVAATVGLWVAVAMAAGLTALGRSRWGLAAIVLAAAANVATLVYLWPRLALAPVF